MSSLLEANKALVMRVWEEGYQQRNLDVFDAVFDPSYTERHSDQGYFEKGGPDRAKQSCELMHMRFGSLSFEVEQMIAEGDYVTTRAVVGGIHKGKYLGVPATFQPVYLAVVVISKIKNGMIVEDWTLIDKEVFLTQTGRL